MHESFKALSVVIPSDNVPVWRIGKTEGDRVDIVGALPDGEQYTINIPANPHVIDFMMAVQPAAMLAFVLLEETDGASEHLASLMNHMDSLLRRSQIHWAAAKVMKDLLMTYIKHLPPDKVNELLDEFDVQMKDENLLRVAELEE